MMCGVSKSSDAPVYVTFIVSVLVGALSQDSLDSGATLEESSGMDLDAEAVRDAENNINTARWAGLSSVSPLSRTDKVIRV